LKTLLKEQIFNGEKYAILPSTRMWPQSRELFEDQFAMRGPQNHFLTAVVKDAAYSQILVAQASSQCCPPRRDAGPNGTIWWNTILLMAQ